MNLSRKGAKTLVKPILDVGFGIADLLYRFALSFFIKLIRTSSFAGQTRIQKGLHVWKKYNVGTQR